MGGKFGINAVIPTKANEESSFQPKNFATALVGMFLLIMCLIYIFKSTIFKPIMLNNTQILYFLNQLSNFVGWCISFIFILRGIGDFNYVGLFKK